MHLSNKEKLLNTILKRDFRSFLHKSFNTISGGKTFIPNWHIEMLAEKLRAVEEGKIKRLIINIPPRSLKSITVSVAWPAWLLGQNPNKRIIAVSYSQKLSDKHSLDTKDIITSPWYKKLFPDTKLHASQQQKSKFVTTKHGFRLSTSINGTLTGEGGDIIIVDDPHSVRHAFSGVFRQNAIDWFEQTLMSRLDDKNKGAVVIVMQRLHVGDLTGHLLNTQKDIWEHVEVSIMSRADKIYRYSKKEKNYKKDELLYAANDDIANIDKLKKQLGTYNFEAQYMQNPKMQEANMIKPQWISYYDKLPENLEKYISIDSAVKTGKNNDYTALTVWGYDMVNDRHYLQDVVQEKFEYPELIKLIQDKIALHKPRAVIIEDKASGSSIYQELRRNMDTKYIPWNPRLAKDIRLAAITPIFEQQKIYLPQYALWLGAYLEELLLFPNALHDDQVDATTQYIEYITQLLADRKRASRYRCRVL